MKLSARPLISVSSVNDWLPATELQFYKGDPNDVYLQLVDSEKSVEFLGGSASWGPGTLGGQVAHAMRGLRYMPPAASTLLVTFLNLDGSKQFARAATQPFSQDASIWKLSLLATDPLGATVSLKLTLTEPGPVVRGAHLQAVILVSGSNETC